MRRGRVKREERRRLLAQVPLFAGCSEAELGHVVAITAEESFDTGAAVVLEGEDGWDFFILVEGEAEVRHAGRRINVMGPGEFFGEIALVAEVPRTATVVASSPLLVLTIRAYDFTELLDEQPAIARKVLRALGERLAASSG